MTLPQLREIIEQNRKARADVASRHLRLRDALLTPISNEQFTEVINDILGNDARQDSQLPGETGQREGADGAAGSAVNDGQPRGSTSE